MPPHRRNDPEARAEALLVLRLAAAGVVVGVLFAAVGMFIINAPIAAVALISAVAAVGPTPWLYKRTGSMSACVQVFAATLLAIICVIGTFRGGFPTSTLAFALLIPPIARSLGGMRVAVIWTAVAVAIVVGFVVLSATGNAVFPWSVEKPAWTWAIVDGLGIVVMLVFLALMAAWSEAKRAAVEARQRRAEAALVHARKMDSIGSVAGGIAHDFNNALAAIGLIVATTKHTAAPGSALETDMNDAAEAVRRAAQLTRRLLRFGRRDDDAEPQSCDTRTAFMGATRMLRRSLPRTVRFEVEQDERLPEVAVSETELWQVVLNLVVNARDAMPDGGSVDVAVEHVQVGGYEAETLQVEPGGYVRVRVSDTGTGIPEEVRDRIFEPFVTTKRKDSGTGLGLATVYTIAAHCGGTALVDRTGPEGTTFHVYLGIAKANTSSSGTRPISAPMPVLGGVTVLVVDDDDQLRRATSKALNKQGYTVVQARNADEALDVMANSEAIDVVLTDVVMPGMSGPELAERLSNHENDVPVVFMSGRMDSAVADRDVLKKPFGAAALVRHIQRHLEPDDKSDS